MKLSNNPLDSFRMSHSSYPSTQLDFHLESVLSDFALVVLHTISVISLHLWCMLRGSV